MRLDASKIKSALKYDACEALIFDSIDSTNTYGKQLVLSGAPTPCIVLAEEQTSGRGRLGRSFFSPYGTGLYMSILCKTHLSPDKATFATVSASVAAAKAIEALSSKNVEIKWVNDLYIGGKKAGGILCESVMQNGESALIVGIGINITTESFPEFELNSPTSTGELDRNALAAEIYNNFLYYFAPENRNVCLFEYRERFYLKDKAIVLHLADGTSKCAVARGIDDDGGLIIDIDGKTDIVRSGEVTVRAH